MGRNGKALGVCIAALLLTVFILLALSMYAMLSAKRTNTVSSSVAMQTPSALPFLPIK